MEAIESLKQWASATMNNDHAKAQWVAAEEMAQDKARIAELEAEVKCYCELQDKLSVILTNTANALKGEPDELSMHSWHDLAEVATELKTQLKTAKEKGYEWREFAESAGDPYRPRCGHIVNRGWRCLVCGKDPSDD